MADGPGVPPRSDSVDSLVPTHSALDGPLPRANWLRRSHSVGLSGLCWRQILLAPPRQLESFLRFPTGESLHWRRREGRMKTWEDYDFVIWLCFRQGSEAGGRL